MNSVLDQISNGILGAISGVIIPDWGALIDLLPILLVIGLLGPILTILTFRWVRYRARAPHRSRAPRRRGRGPSAVALAVPSGPPTGGAAVA